MTTCRVCLGPLTTVPDDPSPAHPGCAPSDPSRFAAATGGLRTYAGHLKAIWWSTCACGVRIDEGDDMWLMDTGEGRRWVHSETCPAVIAPEASADAAPPTPAIPAPRVADGDLRAQDGAVLVPRTTTKTDAPRRAVA